MRKKLLSGLLAATMVASLMVGCGSDATTEAPAANDADTEAPADDAADTEAPAEDTNEVSEAGKMEAPSTDGWDDSKKIYVYLWDADGEGKVNNVINQISDYKDYIEVVNINAGGQSDEYKNAVNNALDGGDKYPSIILADESIGKLWSETDKTADLGSIGLSSDMYANSYSYTVDYGNFNGAQKALSWQATPGCFVYRADIASEVLGTDDPAEVGEKISDWDKFMEVAEQLKGAGYKIVSGVDDIQYVALNQRTSPFVSVADDGSETLQLDDTVNSYVEKTKTLYDNGYTNQTALWDGAWAGSMAEGDVFGYFGCTWFIGSMEGNCPSDAKNFGQWRTTTGPDSYYWGGTYVMVGADTPNPELAAYFVYAMCCDEDIMYNLSKDTGDFVNNKAAVERLVADGVGARDILGGQNPFETFADAATSINVQSSYIDGNVLQYITDGAKSYCAGELSSVDDVVQYAKDEVKKAFDYITVE